MTLRKHGRWMVQLDDRILELLEQEESLTEASIQEYLEGGGPGMDYSDVDISIRCETLVNAGFLHFDDFSRQYRITATGRKYLRGECNASNVTFALPSEVDQSAEDLYDGVDRIDN